MAFSSNTSRMSAVQLRVPAEEFPGWRNGAEHMPSVGDQVQCAEGLAQVTKILGKTGDGSRLLELTLPDRPRHPFFAAASNVLVAPAA